MRKMNSVLITGGSSGIGEALAVACAQRGVCNIFLCGRDAGRLAAVVKKCEEIQRQALEDWGIGGLEDSNRPIAQSPAPPLPQSPNHPIHQSPNPPIHQSPNSYVEGRVLDVTDEAAVRAWIEECNAVAPLEVVFSNAGIGTGSESEENVRRTFATNIGGGLNVVLPTIELFRRTPVAADGTPRRRQIVITASIAGYAPLSTCPSYAATKAAMKSWALSLRGMLKGEGIWVNVICPGFIRSRITDRNTCPMPFFMEADRAAKIILDRVDRNIGLIAFPWPMRFGVWLLASLPWRLSEFISRLLPEKTSSGKCKGHEGKEIAF